MLPTLLGHATQLNYLKGQATHLIKTKLFCTTITNTHDSLLLVKYSLTSTVSAFLYYLSTNF